MKGGVTLSGFDIAVRLQDGTTIRGSLANKDGSGDVMLCNSQGVELVRWSSSDWSRDPGQVIEQMLQAASSGFRRGVDPNAKHSSPDRGGTSTAYAIEVKLEPQLKDVEALGLSQALLAAQAQILAGQVVLESGAGRTTVKFMREADKDAQYLSSDAASPDDGAVARAVAAQLAAEICFSKPNNSDLLRIQRALESGNGGGGVACSVQNVDVIRAVFKRRL